MWKRYHFWVLSSLIAVVLPIVWIVSIGGVVKEYKTNKEKVTNTYNRMLGLAGAKNPPNDLVSEMMIRRTDRRRMEVYKAWRDKYRAQLDILVWPPELGDEFISIVKKLFPIEETVPFPAPEEKLDRVLRKKYSRYVKQELQRLAAKIKAGKWGAKPVADADAKDSPAGRRDKSVVVQWNLKNQEDIEQHHFDWSNRADGTDYPTTLEVLYAQEDLWVLSSLIDIIAKTNEGAERYDQAAIREIDFIHIGEMVGERAGRRDIVIQGAASDGSSDEEEVSEGVPGGGAPDGGGFGAEGAEAETAAANDPAEGRYVDKDYKPLSAARLRSAAESNNPEDAYLTVAKRMPIRMRLKMDQRKINKLLVECGNSNLMVEIQQVRVNRQPGNRSPGRAGGAPAAFGRGGSSHGAGSGSSGSGITKDPEYPWDVYVELYGIIYIYNQPDAKRLGFPDGKLPELDGTAEPGKPNPKSPPKTDDNLTQAASLPKEQTR